MKLCKYKMFESSKILSTGSQPVPSITTLFKISTGYTQAVDFWRFFFFLILFSALQFF